MSESDKDPADKKPENAGAQDEANKNPEGASAREGEVDWKALLQIEREGRIRAEGERDSYKKGVNRLERQLRRKPQQDNEPPLDDPDDDDDSKPVTRADLRDVIEPILGQNKFESLLTSMIADPAKREYVKDIYNNRIRRTGTSDEAIRADLEAALDLANAKTFKKENDELKRMNDNRVYVPPAGGGGSGGGGGNVTQKAHEWTPEQEAQLERRAQNAGIDAEKFKERAWKEFQQGTAFAVKPKPRS